MFTNRFLCDTPKGMALHWQKSEVEHLTHRGRSVSASRKKKKRRVVSGYEYVGADTPLPDPNSREVKEEVTLFKDDDVQEVEDGPPSQRVRIHHRRKQEAEIEKANKIMVELTQKLNAGKTLTRSDIQSRSWARSIRKKYGTMVPDKLSGDDSEEEESAVETDWDDLKSFSAANSIVESCGPFNGKKSETHQLLQSCACVTVVDSPAQQLLCRARESCPHIIKPCKAVTEATNWDDEEERHDAGTEGFLQTRNMKVIDALMELKNQMKRCKKHHCIKRHNATMEVPLSMLHRKGKKGNAVVEVEEYLVENPVYFHVYVKQENDDRALVRLQEDDRKIRYRTTLSSREARHSLPPVETVRDAMARVNQALCKRKSRDNDDLRTKRLKSMKTMLDEIL